MSLVKPADDGAWWVHVQGLTLPKRISGHPALELPNTWAGWSTDGRPLHPEDETHRDYLRTPEHLDVLARDRDLLPSGAPPCDGATLDEARALRPVLYRVARGIGSAEDLTRVSDLARDARSASRLERDRDGGHTWVLTERAGPRAVVLAAGAALADLLVGGGAGRVRSCPGTDCGWLFFNASGRRRWCQMAVCGNRAKQATFQAREA